MKPLFIILRMFGLLLYHISSNGKSYHVKFIKFDQSIELYFLLNCSLFSENSERSGYTWISLRSTFLQVLILCSCKRFGFVGKEWHSTVGRRKAASTAVHLNMKQTSFYFLNAAKFIFTCKKCKSVKNILTSLEYTYDPATSVIMYTFGAILAL
jgi:hypothetical protein